MGLVEAKMKILETLWAQGAPMRSKDVAKNVGLSVAAATMHLLGLRKSGHVYTPKHGLYAITELGKEAIGLPKVDKAHAAKILGNVSADKGFHFYTGVHQYTHVIAHSLTEFADKLQKIEVKAIDFHISRKDFEHWIRSMGDEELAKKLNLIHKMNLRGEDLRERLHETIKHRIEELKQVAGL